MSPADLRRRILRGDQLEDRELLVLLWGAGSGSAADAISNRAEGLLEAAGGLEGWVDSTTPQLLRRRGISGARAARLLAAAEIARRARSDSRPRDLDAVALSALDLVAVALESIADAPSPREVTMCAELIRALQRTAVALGAQPQPLDPWYQQLLDATDPTGD